MADTKQTAETYTNGGLVDALDGGMHYNAQYIDELAGLNDLVAGANARIYSATDTDFDYDAFMAEEHEKNETWKTDAYKDLTSMCRTNAMANGVAIGISAIAATTSAAGVVSKAGAAKNGGKLLSQQVAAKAGESTGIKKIALQGVQAALRFGEGQAGAASRVLHHTTKEAVQDAATDVTKTIVKSAIKVTPLRLMGAAAIELAPAALPLVVANVYTTGRTEEVKKEYQEAISTTQAAYNYLTEEAPDVETQVGKDYEAWRSGYETSQQALLDQFQSGQITKDEYDRAYEEFLTSSSESLQALNDQHKEMGQKIVENGAAGAAFGYAAQQGFDKEEVLPRSYYLQGLADKNPETVEQWDTVIATQKENDTGNGFTNFIANMHAAIIHYLPGAAYVEAAVKKGVDTVLGFVTDKLPLASGLYSQKYEGKSITSLAQEISADAEARYERNQSIGQTVAQMTGDGMDGPETEQGGPQAGDCSPAPA